MIENVKEKSMKANTLRKQGNCEKAIEIYQLIISDSQNPFDYAGYINCLKKIEDIDTAFEIANKALIMDLNQEWLNNEIIWLYIHFIIDVKKENATVDMCLNIVNKLIPRTTSEIQRVKIYSWAFKILKTHKKWDDLYRVINASSSDDFSTEPIVVDGKKGWSYSAVWHHYNLFAIVKCEHSDKSDKLSYVDKLIEKFPFQKKFFIRLKALLLVALNEHEKAQETFSQVLKIDSKSAWLFSDYADSLAESGRKKEALEQYNNAMNCTGKIESKINILKSIAELTYEFKDYNTSFIFYSYYKEVRDNQSWGEKFDVSEKINELKSMVDKKYVDLGTYKNECRKIWQRGTLNRSDLLSTKHEGHLLLMDESKSFCFIKTKDENYFCSKNDLPAGAKNGDRVSFFLKKSFNNKKNEESVSACKVSFQE